MSGVMGADVRRPIGGLFTALGLILVAYGAATTGNAAHWERSLGINIDLWWGIVMVLFGIFFLGLARRAAGRPITLTEEERRARELSRPPAAPSGH